MKNPHGVEPIRFMKRKESDRAISCLSKAGLAFGTDILMLTRNNLSLCFIHNNGTHGYECHPEYKSSLFVNTAGPNEMNKYTLLDYEVFGIDFENRDNINKLCKCPDIIWEYIETKDISEESLQQVDDDTDLLSDLDTIHCDDTSIRLKISRYYFKNPSEMFPNTQLVSQQYDSILRKWVGDYKWRLLYRASEHGYTGESFHECCDDVKGPTLIVIKSSGGWLFGGYTTRSWKVVHPNGRGSIYNDMV